MEELLKAIHFEMFKLIEKEKQLRGNHHFDNDNEEIRNDQSITETMEVGKILRRLEILALNRINE